MEKCQKNKDHPIGSKFGTKYNLNLLISDLETIFNNSVTKVGQVHKSGTTYSLYYQQVMFIHFRAFLVQSAL